MVIIFKDKKLEKQCNEHRKLVQAHGERRARLLRARLDDLDAASSLADISHLPPTRLHELMGNRNGQFSIDLDHPYRLILEVADEPIPYKDDGGVDRAKVSIVRLLEIVDTH